MHRFFLIFHKDVRHFWKELVLSWCLLAVYVYVTAAEQLAGDEAYAIGLFAAMTSSFIAVPMVLSWFLLVVRLVQDERLVGDRQFWLTRPYRWPELLAEKIGFLLLFIDVPLLLAQLAILKLAGFAALPYVGGLLFIQVVILALGAAVFIGAVITATLVQVLWLGFLVLLYIMANSALIGVLPNSSMSRAPSLIDTISSLAAICGLLAVVLIQYAQRRTALARGIIGGLAVLSVVLGVITPYANLIRKEYPRVSGAAPVIIALDTRKPESLPLASRSFHRPAKPQKYVLERIPFVASPLHNDEIAHLEGNRLRVYLPNGQSWQSAWQVQNAVIISAAETYASFAIPLEIFDLAKSTAVKADIEWALAVYAKGESWRLVVQDGIFPAPRFGLCSADPSGIFLHCRAPLYAPGPLWATVTAVDSTCETSSQGKTAPSAYYASFSSRSEPVPGINPVLDERVVFSASGLSWPTEERWLPPRICPGTSINFASLELMQRASAVTTLNDLRLAEYQEGEARLIALP